MTRAPGHLFQRKAIDTDAVLIALGRVEQEHKGRAWLAILGGSLVCLLVALALALLYLLLTFGTIGGWGFKVTFAIMAVVCLPPLFLLALRVQRPIATPATPASEQIRDRRDDGDEPDPGLRKVGELANIGPRLVLWGVDRLRAGTSAAFGPLPPDRVATALIKLADADGGISPAALLQPGESADHLEPLLGVLLYHDLADMGKRADKVWITTEAKRLLGLPV